MDRDAPADRAGRDVTALAAKPDVCQPTGTAELAMLDIFMPMMKSAGIVAAARIGLFEALARGALSLAELAASTGANPTGVRTLADFLVALGYLTKNGDAFANTASTQRWLTSLGEVDYTPGVLWTHEAWAMMGELDDTVRRGGPDRTLWDRMADNPGWGPLFSSYMSAFARDLGPDLVAHVPVTPSHRRLLDLGGSHGLHAIRFCERYDGLQAVIVDLKSALTRTEATVAAHGLADRVALRPGSLLDQDWGGGYDLVLYLSVAHNMTDAQNESVIARVAAALNPGGLLVIHEYLAENPLNAFHAAFRLTLLYETGTTTHAFADVERWVTAAGMHVVARKDLNPLEKGSLVIARK